MSETLEYITNIKHLRPFEFEKDDFRYGIQADVPRMLASIAIDAKLNAYQRKPLNFHISYIGRESGDRSAMNLIKHASDMPVFPEVIEKDLFHEDGLWIGAKRLNAWHLAGSVIVQRGVSLIDEKNRTIIDNGIIVEAVTATELKHELPSYYEAGIAVAESMAEKTGEVIYAVETAETYAARQKRIERWIRGKLTYDGDIHDSVHRNFAHKSDPVSLRRSDFGGVSTVPAIIYTDSKHTIDLTSSK